MKRNDAETIITEYIKSIFGFALKRCRSVQDAEDLSQEILLKAWRALMNKDDIDNPAKFIWTVAHNALNNYYRDRDRRGVGVSLEEIEETLADESFSLLQEDERGAIEKMRSEIAYLSKLQRQIVIAYYFQNKKQAEIAQMLDIPLGTVKWHLFEAKKELKRGMDTVRQTSELQFNPIKFSAKGITGSIGNKMPEDLFRSALTQNICYCVRNEAKTINEIAAALGVSPAYVEGEVDFLEEYEFLKKQKDKYIINFIISEPSSERLAMENTMYKKAAALFADTLYNELTASGLLDHPDIWCGQTDEPISLTHSPRADHNYLLWSLIPFIAAWSGEHLKDERIKFDEVATLRPDGGYNIFNATVLSDHLVVPKDYVHMKNWCGPMWNGNDTHILWQIDNEWCDRDPSHRGVMYHEDSLRVLSLHEREFENALSVDEYVWLVERGYVKNNGDYDGYFKSTWQIVVLSTPEIKRQLLQIGDQIKERLKDELDAIKARTSRQ
ncbi:MAG: RNA polymerase sigma factor [Clostridia bacterium]|nr:RNA polymerase sigma factor [Clostridia bacterium]